MFSTSTRAQTIEGQSPDDRLLEERVLSASPKSTSAAAPKKFSMSNSLAELRNFSKAAAQTPKCTDATKTVFSKKYVLSRDAAGKPCRIYDLSFPSLKSLFSAKKTLQVPVQKLTSKEYLNWLDGNNTAVEQSREEFRRTFNPRQAAKTSWVTKLKFRNQPSVVEGSRSSSNEIGLPRSFRIADLDIGQYRFDSQTQADIHAFLAELQNNPSIQSEASVESDYMIKVLKTPETMLQGIRLDWNDLDKVYDVILEGDFLPFSGAVALIDYQTQYKFAVEKIFRSILSSGLQSIAGRIPNQTMSTAVEVLINDAFEQIEMAYSYQMVQLEDTLRSGVMGRSEIGIDAATSGRAFNILHGQKSDLFSAYILSVAQGKPFDWTAFEGLGKNARYNVEKQRDIMMSKLNSRLVLEKKCQTDFVQDYFAVCTLNGKKDALYSVISEQVIFNKGAGAPLIYRYQRPYEASLRRGVAWGLSIALRVFGLPISRFAIEKLDPMVKGVVSAGVLDEALIRSFYSNQQSAGTNLNTEDSQLLSWLYIQNLNPFLPKSQASEESVIAANKRMMGLN